MKCKFFDSDTYVMAFAFVALALPLGLCVWVGYVSDQKFKELDGTSEQNLRAKTFVYNHHRYIQFEKNNALSSTYIVHDPQCSCNEQESDESEEYIRPTKFEYQGHMYIQFGKKRTIDAASIVHDPDCK